MNTTIDKVIEAMQFGLDNEAKVLKKDNDWMPAAMLVNGKDGDGCLPMPYKDNKEKVLYAVVLGAAVTAQNPDFVAMATTAYKQKGYTGDDPVKIQEFKDLFEAENKAKTPVSERKGAYECVFVLAMGRNGEQASISGKVNREGSHPVIEWEDVKKNGKFAGLFVEMITEGYRQAAQKIETDAKTAKPSEDFHLPKRLSILDRYHS